jgi:hypothetical protein
MNIFLKQASAYLEIRRALQKDAHIVDIWGSKIMQTGVGGLEASHSSIARIASDRSELRGIRWGVCLRDEVVPQNELFAPYAENDCSNNCKLLALTTNTPLIGTIGFWRVDASSYSAEIGTDLAALTVTALTTRRRC